MFCHKVTHMSKKSRKYNAGITKFSQLNRKLDKMEELTQNFTFWKLSNYQLVTGMLLSVHYTPNIYIVFEGITHIC